MTEQSKDFRIGNLVKYDNRIFEIDSISDVFPTLNTAEFGIGVVGWNDLCLIPLTSELLVKYGFVFTNGNNKYGWYLEISKNRTLCWCHSKEISMEFDYDDHDFNGTLFDFNCEYIHQLQNLYFVLTNKELTLK